MHIRNKDFCVVQMLKRSAWNKGEKKTFTSIYAKLILG